MINIPLWVKLRVCWHVLTERSVIFNVHFFGKSRIKRPARGFLSVWENTFEEPIVGYDNFIVLPDDLPAQTSGPHVRR